MPPVHCRADVDTASSINTKLEEGLHVVLAAGIFNLDAPLQVNNPTTVILGLGMVTLVSSNVKRGHLCGRRDEGICVAGLLLNAGPLLTKALLEWGTSSYAGDAQNAGMLHVADALKRTWDTSLNYSVASGKLSIAIRSNSASERPSLMTWYLPEYLVNIWPGITRLGFFWVEDRANPSLCWTFTA